MVRTRVGYTGGTTPNPTYYSLGDHTETVQIAYDPTQITYEELLEVFWGSHDARQPAGSRQYMSAIFTHSQEQQRLAEEVKARLEARSGSTLHTVIAPAGTFYLAEDYHQKYSLRRHPDLLAEFTAVYPTTADLIASTAVARVNGYLGGFGTLEQVQAELESLGLSPAGQQVVLAYVSRWSR